MNLNEYKFIVSSGCSYGQMTRTLFTKHTFQNKIFDEFGEFKLNVLINRYGSKLDYQTESDIPSKSYRYNTFNIEDLDYYLDDYDEFDR